MIEDRKDAIGKAIAEKQAEDIICIAGKGHEDYQIIGEQTLPFCDRDVVLAEIMEGIRHGVWVSVKVFE